MPEVLFVLSHSVILRVKIWVLSGVYTKHSECHRQKQAQFSVLFVTGTPIGDKSEEEEEAKPTKIKPTETQHRGNKNKIKKKQRQQNKRNNRVITGVYVGTGQNADELLVLTIKKRQRENRKGSKYNRGKGNKVKQHFKKR